MATKAYAGFRMAGSDPTQWLVGNEGWILCPVGHDDYDPKYRSRLGYQWSNSGPWCVIDNVVDVSSPSTDGAYNIMVTGGGRNVLLIRVFDGCKYMYVGWKCNGYSPNYNLSLDYAEETWVTAEYRPTHRYKYKCKVLKYATDTQYIPQTLYPWTVGDCLRVFRERDFATALAMAQWARSNIRSLPNRVTPTDGYVYYELNADARRNVDLTPSPISFGDVLDSSYLYLETGILPGTWARGWETAYTEACKDLPQAATNVAANVLEAASLLTSLVTGDILEEVPKRARDAWLAYRYAYTTTKLDVREFQSTFARLDALSQSQTVAVYGSYTRGDITYRVGFDIDTAQVIPRDVSTTLQKFGLELNALNVWDMIPYSFVVDWFLPISDLIEYFQDLDACRYEPQDLWFSLTTVREGQRIRVRLPGRKLSTLPYLQLSHAGSRTIALRIADAVALFAP